MIPLIRLQKPCLLPTFTKCERKRVDLFSIAYLNCWLWQNIDYKYFWLLDGLIHHYPTCRHIYHTVRPLMHPSEQHCSLLDHLLYHKRHLLASEDELRVDHSRRCKFWELNKDTPIQSLLDILDTSILILQAPFPLWSDVNHQMIEPFNGNMMSGFNLCLILEWKITTTQYIF